MAIKVLIVDDNKKNIRLLKEILEDEGYLVDAVEDSTKAFEKAMQFRPDLVLLDIMMPVMDGFELCRQMKNDFELRGVQIIMVTARTDGKDVKRALELGAFDYIKKPLDEIEVIARVQSALRFKRNQDSLKELSMKDSLTGLYNHGLILELLDNELSKQERETKDISFVMLDIDHFKKVNDQYGHVAGDVILKQLSVLCKSFTRKHDYVGRYGGEEFSLILSDADTAAALEICERLRKQIEDYAFHVEDNIIRITVSMGICSKSYEDELSVTDMVKQADEALYEAKQNGRNQVRLAPKANKL